MHNIKIGNNINNRMTSVLLESRREMTFSNRRTYNGRLTYGRSKKAYHWMDSNTKPYDWLDLNSKQEGLRLVGFKYQKADDWLNSKCHRSYLESRGVPEKTREIREKSARKYIPFISGSRLPVPVTSLVLHTIIHRCDRDGASILLMIFRNLKYVCSMFALQML